MNCELESVVFFSIVSCFSQFTNLSEVGKIGSRVISMYLLTTVIAVVLGIGIFHLVQPGEFGFALNSGFVTHHAAPIILGEVKGIYQSEGEPFIHLSKCKAGKSVS